MKPDPLATPDEVAEFLQKPPKTLAEWRSKDRGPRYFRLDGGQVRYDWADVRKWLAAQAVTISAARNGS